jgi:CheY-like chemotaxis protein
MNFAGVRVLIVDSDPHATRILSKMLNGFGLTLQTVVDSGEKAKAELDKSPFELLICEAVFPDMPSADLLHWIRRHGQASVKFLPVVVLTGYTQVANVTAARDSGANNVVKKPVVPNVLLDHLTWSARTPRPFVETSGYSGPDRRFKFAGPPDGVGRRDKDLPPEVGAATEPNMSQEEIDALMKPNKVAV